MKKVYSIVLNGDKHMHELYFVHSEGYEGNWILNGLRVQYVSDIIPSEYEEYTIDFKVGDKSFGFDFLLNNDIVKALKEDGLEPWQPIYTCEWDVSDEQMNGIIGAINQGYDLTKPLEGQITFYQGG